MVRDSREAFKTRQGVFDAFTERVLQKLAGQKRFDALRSIISPGKEAVVFTAQHGEETVAVKIYKLETSKFSKMYEYIRVDPRYARVQNRPRQVIFAWAEREYRNLLLVRQAGVHAPLPIAHKENVIVMECIGHGHTPSPLLKACPPQDPQAFGEECMVMIRRLEKAGFAHGDLSEYNIINHDEHPVLIDFSHMAPLTAPGTKELLERDLKNVKRYFAGLGVDL